MSQPIPPHINSATPWDLSQINSIIPNPTVASRLRPVQSANALPIVLSSYQSKPSPIPTNYQLVHPAYLSSNCNPTTAPKIDDQADLMTQTIHNSTLSDSLSQVASFHSYPYQGVSNQTSLTSLPFIFQSDQLLLTQFQLQHQLPLLLAPPDQLRTLNLSNNSTLSAENTNVQTSFSNIFPTSTSNNYVAQISTLANQPIMPCDVPTTLNHVKSCESIPSSEKNRLLSNNILSSISSSNVEVGSSEQNVQNEKAPQVIENVPNEDVAFRINRANSPSSLDHPISNCSELNEISNQNEEQSYEKPFVMGEISTETYYPTHFLRGSMICLANGTLRKVEDLSTDDFLSAASKTSEFSIEPSTYLGCTKSNNHAQIFFSAENSEREYSIDVQLEYPLFVLGKGWCSIEPERTLETYGLEAKLVKAGDICITMKQRHLELDILENVVPITQAHDINQREIQLATWRDELEENMTETHMECMKHGRASAPPRLEKICTGPLSYRYEMYEI